VNVLIVAKTQMARAVCIGGLTAGGQSIRLLDSMGRNQPLDTAFSVGQVWDIDFGQHPKPVPPHVEDVFVHSSRLLKRVLDIREPILQRIPPWSGGPEALYNGLLEWTSYGKGYVSQRGGVPGCSTGYWLPDVDLVLEHDGPKALYCYPGHRGTYRLPYVGCANPINRIPAETLVRVSLARWWQPVDAIINEERCYLQLSGWYLPPGE
jgi:hypothetical protein